MSRTLIWVAIGCVIFFSALGVFAYKKNSSIDDRSDTPIYQPDIVTSRVFIKNLHTYGQYFEQERHLSIEQTLHSFTIQSGVEPDLFTGIIRDKSLSQSPSGNGNILTRVFVDIYPANLTYSLEIDSGNNTGGIRPITIRCAPPEQQINPSIKCVSGVGVG